MLEWISVKESGFPQDQDFKRERRRYIAFRPSHMGYVYRCWYKDGFGSDSAQSMLSNVTHYRIARRGEKDHQISASDFEKLTAQ
jgi:hypothetical protein